MNNERLYSQFNMTFFACISRLHVRRIPRNLARNYFRFLTEFSTVRHIYLSFDLHWHVKHKFRQSTEFIDLLKRIIFQVNSFLVLHTTAAAGYSFNQCFFSGCAFCIYAYIELNECVVSIDHS